MDVKQAVSCALEYVSDFTVLAFLATFIGLIMAN